MKGGLRDHIAVCISPLTTFEFLLETSNPKKGAVGEQQNQTNSTDNRIPIRHEQPQGGSGWRQSETEPTGNRMPTLDEEPGGRRSWRTA
jgi:hypothetical protein